MAEKINMARDKVVELEGRQKRNSIYLIKVPEVEKQNNGREYLKL